MVAQQPRSFFPPRPTQSFPAGNIYYYNSQTQESTWAAPTASGALVSQEEYSKMSVAERQASESDKRARAVSFSHVDG